MNKIKIPPIDLNELDRHNMSIAYKLHVIYPPVIIISRSPFKFSADQSNLEELKKKLNNPI